MAITKAKSSILVLYWRLRNPPSCNCIPRNRSEGFVLLYSLEESVGLQWFVHTRDNNPHYFPLFSFWCTRWLSCILPIVQIAILHFLIFLLPFLPSISISPGHHKVEKQIVSLLWRWRWMRYGHDKSCNLRVYAICCGSTVGKHVPPNYIRVCDLEELVVLHFTHSKWPAKGNEVYVKSKLFFHSLIGLYNKVSRLYHKCVQEGLKRMNGNCLKN